MVCATRCDTLGKVQFYLQNIQPRDIKLESNHEEASDKLKNSSVWK